MVATRKNGTSYTMMTNNNINLKNMRIMEKDFAKIVWVSYTEWKDFGFNLLPNIYFLRDDDEDGLCRTFGIGWLCWALELVW